MRSQIEFYYKPVYPVALYSFDIELSAEDLLVINEKDRMTIDSRFEELVAEGRKNGKEIFSKPRGLASLYNVEGKQLTYKRTGYKEYNAISTTSNSRILNDDLYCAMRVAAVCATLELRNGQVFVHRRSHNSSHVSGIIDSSCAGLCHVREDSYLDPELDIVRKCEAELNLMRDEFDILGVSGIHSSYAPDFSGVIDITLRTNLSAAELSERLDKMEFAETFYVNKEELPDFVYHHYVEAEDMVGDGAAALLSCLEKEAFNNSIERLRKAGKHINWGKLHRGELVNG